MSRDARNSILLWVGTLVFMGLFWAGVHFNIGVNIPDRWLWSMVGIVVSVDILRSIWGFFRKHKAEVR